eukprot:928976-Heterocapsa_arctica.AAC.1
MKLKWAVARQPRSPGQTKYQPFEKNTLNPFVSPFTIHVHAQRDLFINQMDKVCKPLCKLSKLRVGVGSQPLIKGTPPGIQES